MQEAEPAPKETTEQSPEIEEQVVVEKEGPPENLEDLRERMETGFGAIVDEDFTRIAEDEKENPDRLIELLSLQREYHRRTYERLIQELGYDPKTKLMTRPIIERSLRGAFNIAVKDPSQRLVVIMSDLDFLSEANRAGEGHEGGDKLIIRYAELLRQAFGGSTDMIGRWYSGDEFIVVVKGPIEEAERLERELSDRMKGESIQILGKSFPLSATSMMAELDPRRDIEEQWKRLSRQIEDTKVARDKRIGRER